MSDLTSNTYTQAFFIVPSYILDLPGMTLGYLRVYEAIFQFWNHNKTCFLSEAALCERSGLQRRHVYNALAFFEQHNELKRVQKKYKRYIVRPEKIIETDCKNIKLECTPVHVSKKIDQQCTTVHSDVHSSAPAPCTPVHHNNKKLNKEDITTTEPVVVVKISDSNNLNPQQIKTLQDTYIENPFETKLIKNQDDFIGAVEFSIEKRGQGVTIQGRIKGIIKLVKSGLFEDPPEWKGKNVNKKETPEERMRRYAQEREDNIKRRG